MAASNVQNVDDNLDFIFECFIETLCSTHKALCIDTDAQRKCSSNATYLQQFFLSQHLLEVLDTHKSILILLLEHQNKFVAKF